MTYKTISRLGLALLSLTYILPTDAESLQIKQLQKSAPVTIVKPAIIDSVSLKNEKFSEKKLLCVPIESGRLNWSVADCDTAGYIAENAPKTGFNIICYRFFLNNQSFAKAKLNVKSPAMFEIYQNGKKINDKATTEESFEKAGSVSAPLLLEPGQKEYLVKCLYSSDTEGKTGVQIAVECDSTQHIACGLEQLQPLTIEDLMTGPRVSYISISPDGNYIMVNGWSVSDDGKSSYSARIYEIKNNRLIAQWNNPQQMKWMPHREILTFTQEELGNNKLIAWNPATREQEVLATHFPKDYFQWLPNEKGMIFQVKEEYPKETKEVFQVLNPDDRQPGWRDRSQLLYYDLATGVLQPLTFGYHNMYIQDIRSDSKKMIISAFKLNIRQQPFEQNQFLELNLETMKLDTVFDTNGYINSAVYSPDGKKLLVLGSGDAFNGIGRNIKEGQTANLFDIQGFIYEMETKKVEPITRDFNPSIESAFWSTADNQIYLNCSDRDYQNEYVYNPSSKKFKKLNTKVDIVYSFDMASNKPISCYAGNSTSYADQVYSLNLKNNSNQLIEDTQKEKMSHYRLGEVKDWNFTSTDGTQIEGRYYLPANFDPSQKYPMVVYYYGGTLPTTRGFFQHYSMHLYAAQGYVVYVLNPSGTIGYGQEFAARHVNAWGKQTADDIITGVKQFCKEHPFVNEKKIGCIGASYGGFMTMYLQTCTDIFAAAVSHAGISTISSYWGEGYWGYSYSAAASANSYPWNNAKMYVEQSPLFHADKINTPMLLLHGTADTNVPIGESIQMFTALKILGKPVNFIQVKGENHGIRQFDKRLLWQKSIFAFFAKWLKEDPQWWNKMYETIEIE